MTGSPPADPPSAPGGSDAPDARFVLAAERTFLAWQRTALALVAAGLAAAELLRTALQPVATVLGAALVVVGGGVAAGSFVRHRAVGRALEAGLSLPQGRLPAVLAGTTVAAAGGALALLVSLGS